MTAAAWKVNRNAIYLVIFVVMLGVGVVGSCIMVPNTHYISEKVPVYKTITMFDADDNEVGHIAISDGKKTRWHYAPSTGYAWLCMVMVLLAFFGGLGTTYNIARLRGWELDDC